MIIGPPPKFHGTRDILRKFGGRELEYGVSGLVVDAPTYQNEVKNRATACHITTDTLRVPNYFPAYRGGTTRD